MNLQSDAVADHRRYPATSRCLERLLALAIVIGAWAPAAAGELLLEVRETHGLRRGGYPVAALVELPEPMPRETPFQLSHGGNTLTAQFRPAEDGAAVSRWWLDFVIVLGALETQQLTIDYGKDVTPSPEPMRGHKLQESADAFVIANEPYITWTVPRDLRGLTRSVDFTPHEHLRPDSPGLVVRDRQGVEHPLGGQGVNARVVRSGNQAVALRFEGACQAPALEGVRYVVDLIFPSSVSWVEVVCELDDPQDLVQSIGAGLNLELDAPIGESPTLVDFGAASWVYTSLYAGQAARLEARLNAKKPSEGGDAEPAWQVLRGPPDKMELLAIEATSAGNDGPLAEGWAHVMDRKRCLALAVYPSSAGTEIEIQEEINVTAEGPVSFSRTYARRLANPTSAPKTYRFWLHFVQYPPQYSAGASPQMMQTPPVATVRPR